MPTSGQAGVFDGVIPLLGFYETECDEQGPFVWARRNFSVRKISTADRFAVEMCFNSEEGKLLIRSGDGFQLSTSLCKGWHTYPLDLTKAKSRDISFELSRVPDVPGDARELGVMTRAFRPVPDSKFFEDLCKVSGNKLLNNSELLAGTETLESLPPRLRISVETRCTVKPPCVYCEWEWVKRAERHNALPLTPDTLELLGPFYDVAEEIVDCSYGEPFLNPHLEMLIRRFIGSGKKFEMTSNGQLLSARNREMIADKPMTLYVSLDSSNSGGYSGYRNDKFSVVLDNLRSLCKEKKRHGNKLRVLASYIVMQSNMGDVASFVRLMDSVGVDGIKLRRLYRNPRMNHKSVRRNGVEFVYEDEILNCRSLADVVRQAEQVGRRSSLSIISELDFAQNNFGPGSTICREPWETIYALNRGIHVCCFSRDPVAYWSRESDKPLDEFLREVWNGPAYRDLRSALAEVELHRSCLDRPSCPIVARTLDR